MKMALAVAVLLAFAGCVDKAPDPAPPMSRSEASPDPSGVPLALLSSAFDHGGPIPDPYTCNAGTVPERPGQDHDAARSPPLHFGTPPNGTVAWALGMADVRFDVDARWTFWNLPVDVTGLHAGASILALGGTEGRSYWAPCALVNGDHIIVWRLFALNAFVDINGTDELAELEEQLGGHVLASTELHGTFRRLCAPDAITIDCAP